MADLTTVDHGALVDALQRAGYEIEDRTLSRIWIRIPSRRGAGSVFTVPTDPEAPEYRRGLAQVLANLEAVAEEGRAAQKVLDALNREGAGNG